MIENTCKTIITKFVDNLWFLLVKILYFIIILLLCLNLIQHIDYELERGKSSQIKRTLG